VVKVVTDHLGNALYFLTRTDSVGAGRRQPPSRRRLHYIHLGLYMYRRDTLLKLASSPPGGWRMRKSLSSCARWSMAFRSESGNQPASLRVDTPEDVDRWQRSSNS